MIIERLSEDTLFLPISARKGVFFVALQDYLADKNKRRCFWGGDKRIKTTK